MIRILLIGPLPPPMGGDTRHFSTLVDDLHQHEHYSVQLINTSRGESHSSWLRNLAVSVKTLFRIVFTLSHVDIVSYHASDRGMVLFGPLVVMLGKLSDTPIVLRLFGGSFGDFYQSQNQVIRFLIRKLVLSANVILLQTRRAIRQLQEQATGRLVWFSTYLKYPGDLASPSRYEGRTHKSERCRKFIFLGHLWKTKGVETILETAARLPADSVIDMFGPLDEYTAEEIEQRGMGRIRYCGFLAHAEVEAKLWEYDCLVLPTYHPGEGYPGVIAEAFAHARPVITTNWLAIPEIVDESCGILIEPGDTDAFVAAVQALYSDTARWVRLKEGARARAHQFDHATWSKKFESICEDLTKT